MLEETKNDVRKVMKLIQGEWIECHMSDVYKGDVFKIFNPDGTPAAGGFILKATANAFLDEDGFWSVSTELEKGRVIDFKAPGNDYIFGVNHGEQTHTFVIGCENRPLLTINYDSGEVTVGKDWDLDEGAKIFCDYVAKQEKQNFEKMQRYEEALKFYANPEIYNKVSMTSLNRPGPSIITDCKPFDDTPGRHARIALGVEKP
jgi:hypothetical protein